MSLFYGYHDDDNNKNEEYITKKGGEITGELILNKAIIKNNPINKYGITNMNYINGLFLETIILNELKESKGFYKMIEQTTTNFLLIKSPEIYLIFMINHYLKMILLKVIMP